MAQTEKVTAEGITELGKLWAEAASTGMETIVALNMATVCTAVVGSTYLDPADTATHHTDSGLAIQDIDTVAATATGVDFDHVFTATGTKNVAGIHVCNHEAPPDVCFIEACFAAVIAMENTDTLTIDGSVVMADA